MVPVKKQNFNSKQLLFADLPRFARHVAEQLEPGDVICLTGPIGAGKTTFVSALCRELGLCEGELVSSPTFTIEHIYQTDRGTVQHLDLYRLKTETECEELGIMERLLSDDMISFVEWGDRVSGLKDLYTKKIHFDYMENNSLERYVAVEGFQLNY